MSLMSDLIATYNQALDKGLVDSLGVGSKGTVLLPVYHSSKISTGEDIFEITIDKNSNAVNGQFLEKEEFVIFPITEDSITRSGSKVAPHAISDELSYLGKGIDEEKNKAYIEGIKALLDYETRRNCESFKIIGRYLINNNVLEDFKKFHLRGRDHSIQKGFILKYEEVDEKGKKKTKSMDLKKIFITFKLEREYEGDLTLTRDVDIHNFYIDFVRNKNSLKKQDYCDITGEMDYCVERHRGLLGNAKLIGISNHDETYYGRFKAGKDIYHVSFEASQKGHNMLKYLIENKNHSRYIGEGAYLINWLAQDLEKGGVELLSEIKYEDNQYLDELENLEDLDLEDLEETEEKSMNILGGDYSAKLKEYFFGMGTDFSTENDFHVLIIEKISNGRLSIKYNRKLSRSEAYKRVMNWYKTTSWRFYSRDKSPSLYEIVNFIYGLENKNGLLACENKKLFRSTVERLIPCIIDGHKIPRDIVKTTFYKLSNKQSYKKSWNNALNIGCALIKKQRSDYNNYLIDVNKISEVKQLVESRSFYYGNLMAIFEKIELDAIGRRDGDDEKKGKGSIQRITNSDRLWSSMIRTPERTRFILESKIKPYLNMLKRNSPGIYVFYDKLITSITLKLVELAETEGKQSGSLNEDFILGYYYQKNEFYQKKIKDPIEGINDTLASGE